MYAITSISGQAYSDCCRQEFNDFKVVTVPSIYILDCLTFLKNEYEFLSSCWFSFIQHRNKIKLKVSKHLKEPVTGQVLLTYDCSYHLHALRSANYKSEVKKSLVENAFQSVVERLECNFIMRFIYCNAACRCSYFDYLSFKLFNKRNLLFLDPRSRTFYCIFFKFPLSLYMEIHKWSEMHNASCCNSFFKIKNLTIFNDFFQHRNLLIFIKTNRLIMNFS